MLKFNEFTDTKNTLVLFQQEGLRKSGIKVQYILGSKFYCELCQHFP